HGEPGQQLSNSLPLMVSAPEPPAAGRPWLLLAGPTAVGKSELALALADKLGGEIVSVDSMQVYRGMDIGTAKPSSTERSRVRHHLLDVAEVNEPFDASRFAVLARTAISDIRARNRVPILCGGTGLYFNALLKGLGKAPPGDPALRKELEQAPLEVLLRELAQRDPATYSRIDRQNPRRILRAIEVIRLTGAPFSAQRADWQHSELGHGLAVGFRRPMGLLRCRVDLRVEVMFEGGLVEETRGLLGRGLGENPVASQALGYRKVIEHLRGERSVAQTIELVKIRTRQFAKRQMTWFRGQIELKWVDLAEGDLEQSVEQIQRAHARITNDE